MREAVRTTLTTIAATLTLIGLYLSLRLVLSQAPFDSDSSHSLLLWQGLRENGIGWLASWRFTQDNWLLSLFPLHFIGYALFGAKPFVPLIGGWLIFVAAAGMAGALAWQCGARRSAPWVAAVLLFAGLEAHLHGLLAYSTTHNSSNLFGLCALWLVLSWLQEGGRGKLLTFGVLLCATALSDPWLLPAYNLPFLLLALTFLCVPMLGVRRPRALTLLGIAALSVLVARTHFFGFITLPNLDYPIGGWKDFSTKFLLLLRELGALVQLVPLLQNAASAFVSVAAVILVALALLGFTLRSGLLRDTQSAGLALFTLYSTAGICAAFLLSDNSGTSFELGARLLINCLYLVAPLLAVLTERHWAQLPVLMRYAAPMLALGFVLSGVISTAPARQGEGWHFVQRNESRILDFLQANNLHYGYGSYWGAAANAVTALSGGTIIVRPLDFDPSGRVYGQWRPQSSWHWYTQADLPAGQHEVFIMLSLEAGEFNGCPALPLCEAALQQQFGAPLRRLDLDAEHRILVWDHPLPALWIDAD